MSQIEVAQRKLQLQKKAAEQKKIAAEAAAAAKAKLEEEDAQETMRLEEQLIDAEA